MKKLVVFLMAAFLAVGFGTAMAQTSVELSTATSGVSTIFYGLTFSTATSGASAYVNTWGPVNNAAKLDAGTTLYAISNTAANATGTELRATALQYVAGATPIGAPQLISGTSNTVIVYLHAANATGVGNGLQAAIGTLGGATLYAINGLSGAAYWTKGLYAFANSGGALNRADGTALRNASASGATYYSLAPVTIVDENTSYSGATIYGVIGGVSATPLAGLRAGVSVFAVSAQTGDFSTTPAGRSAVTDIAAPLTANFNNGVSVVHAAPAVSGTSLFILGFASTGNGVSLYQFSKNNIFDGPSGVTTVFLGGGLGSLFMPTPAVTGGSIYVVSPEGGVTVYRTDNLTRQYFVRYTGGEVISGVSAGPVTDGTFIVLCSTSSVTAYRLNNLSGNSKQWTFNFGSNARYQINSTPAISNGYVWVTMNDLTVNAASTYRFTLSDTFNGAPTILANHGKLVYADPIIVSANLWTATYDPTVAKFTAAGANGNNYWTQFKAGAAKLGANTAQTETPPPAPGDDSGCFISTIK